MEIMVSHVEIMVSHWPNIPAYLNRPPTCLYSQRMSSDQNAVIYRGRNEMQRIVILLRAVPQKEQGEGAG